jgi:Mg-chelatase subunit ChlD
MRICTINLFLAACLSMVFVVGSQAQSNHRKRYPKTKPNTEQVDPAQKDRTQQPAPGKQSTAQPDQKQTTQPGLEPLPDAEAIKIDTEVVTVPVIASDYNDVYVPDLAKHELSVYEDGVKQEIAFFSTIKEAFHVVLMLDTSGSTKEKLAQIQKAAKDFVGLLQSQDRIKIISFDDRVNDLSEFTNNREDLRAAIERTHSGAGTKLYDAVKYALNTLVRVKGRKAIVLFTDGVDSYSDATTSEDNLGQLEESSVIVYPIRYNTRRDTEALLRQQQDQGTINGIPGQPKPPIGTTPPTTGGGDNPIPSGRPGGKDPYELPKPRLPLPSPRGRYPDGRYPDDRYPRDRYPDDRYPDNRYPDNRYPGGGRYPDDRYPDNRYPDNRYPDPRSPNPPTNRRGDDSISLMLDGMYRTAALYLNDLVSTSGGKLYYAEDLTYLPDAFAKIADELRNQYSLGYYPSNSARDGKHRKIQVKTTRRNVVLRARPGYRAPRS